MNKTEERSTVPSLLKPVPPAIMAPVNLTEIERAHCKPEEVKVKNRIETPEGAVFVELECPKRGGAIRQRTFSVLETQCYLAEKARLGEKATPCEKVDAVLKCTNHITPTLTEQFASDVKRDEANECLEQKLNKGEVGAEHTWKAYREFPRRTPSISNKALHDVRLGQYFAGEPIYSELEKE